MSIGHCRVSPPDDDHFRLFYLIQWQSPVDTPALHYACIARCVAETSLCQSAADFVEEQVRYLLHHSKITRASP